MKNNYILTCLILLISLSGFGQSGKLFTVDTELSSSLINQVHQDRNGNIWIATEDGLNRYDGAKFTIYKNDDKDSTSLLNNFIRTIFEDSKGRLFFGFFNGLQHYDAATDTFREIPLLLKSGEKYAAHVLTLLERKNGEILAGTSGQGLMVLKFKGTHIEARQINQLIPSDLISYLYEDKEQNLWISTQDMGLFRLSKNGKLKDFSGSGSIPCNSISGIIEDKRGRLFAGSFKKGFFMLDRATDTFKSIPWPEKENLSVFSLALGKDSTIYIGTEGNGMLVFNPSSNKISESNFNVTSFDFSRSKVHSIIEDNSGNIWAGIFQKGVLVLPNSPNNFNYIGHKSIKSNLIGSDAITAIYKDHKGTLWAGTDGDGIYKIGPDEKHSVHFENTGKPGSVPSTIMSIYEDSNHDLWIGSYLNGLAKLNPETGECSYISDLKDKYNNPVQRVYSITEDEQKNLWIGSMGAGLFKINLNTLEITNFEAVAGSEYRGEANSLHNGWIDCLLLSKKGKLYIGSYDGLGCLDLKTNSFTSTFGKNRLLRGHIIYSLFEDEQETIWIGTSKGLMYIDKSSQEIRTYSMEDGLPGNVISSIEGDNSNNLWISTNYGISKFDLQKRNFFNFYSDDGLQGNEFSKNAAFMDDKGRIYFGGLNGITYFKPAEITTQGKEVDIHITDFYIHDQAVKKGMKSGGQDIITTAVREAGTFNLSHKDNSFSIEFSAMEFINPERITYMYTMDNQNWITLRPGTNNVTFNNLAPGNYNFKVRAKDYNTISNTKEIAVVISPVWYFSTWAKSVWFIILAGITFLIGHLIRNRYRTRKKIQEHIHAKQINEAKLQFFINIAHEIRTPMTLVISPLKKLMNANKDSENQKAYQTMYRNSERILLLINQLMDIRKIDKGQMALKFREVEMVEFIKDLYSIFDEQTQAREVELRFNHEMEQLKAWVDPKNFDKILLNVLANALKFTPEHGKIEIHLSTGKDPDATDELKEYFEIVISDNGIGIEEKELENIFDCFYQTRISQDNFSEGTGIGLHLTRSIVQLHRGTIKAENNKDGQGCRFTIRLPLGNSHLLPEETGNPFVVNKQPEPLIPAIPLISVDGDEIKIKSKSRHRVLVVDDDDEIRKYICEELAPDYHMLDCSNGKEALSLALANPPDLIISDIMMPEMDGITLCQKIKHNVNINHIPVILLTAKSGEEDNLEGIGIGADGYIVKPFNIEILSKTVKNIIRTREMLRNNFSGNQQQTDKIKKVSMKSADEKLMQKIMDIINNNIGNSSFNVEMLAAEIGISRVHLHRKTKELTNQSTRDLIRNIRLQQAANLLASKNLNISEVAFAVGFTNLATFSTAFKDFFGESPTNYMEMQLKQLNKLP